MGRSFVQLALISILGFVVAAKDCSADSSKGRSKKNRQSTSSEADTMVFRLPRYFASIVDDDQRVEIQKIQVDYHKKIAALEEQLAELESAQMKELEGLLTSTQRKTLEKMRLDSGKRTSRTESRSSSSSSKPTRTSTKSSKSGSKSSRSKASGSKSSASKSSASKTKSSAGKKSTRSSKGSG